MYEGMGEGLGTTLIILAVFAIIGFFSGAYWLCCFILSCIHHLRWV